jgi:hypothetical protein
MTADNPIESRPQHQCLVHSAMDAYLGWRDECDAVRSAYRSWSAADGGGTAIAFQAYTAALEREQHASQVYAGLIQRIDDLVAQEREVGAAHRSPRLRITDGVDRVVS